MIHAFPQQVVALQPFRIQERPPGSGDLRREVGPEIAGRRSADPEDAVAEEAARTPIVSLPVQGREQSGHRADLRMLDAVARDEVHRAGSIEVLRDEKVQVRVSLSVRVRRQVHGDAVEVDAHVGAVVRIESAQEELIGFAAALVLRQQKAWHDAEDVLGREPGPQEEVAGAHRSRTRGRERSLAFHGRFESGLRIRP